MQDDVKSDNNPSGESEQGINLNPEKTDNQNTGEKLEDSSKEGVNTSSPDFSVDELGLDNHDDAEEANDPTVADKDSEMPKKNKKRFHFTWPPTKKEWLSSLIFIIIGGVIIAFVANHTGQKPVAQAINLTPAPKKAPTSSLVPSTLSGLPVNPSVNKQAVTAVMIENSDAARPQAGLSQAEVVFEAIAEGGVTRFMALYQDTAPANVGPIRSVRPYYEQWALGFDASIAHVGGSPDALADIKSWNVKDLDEFYNGSYYHRITTRAAPHNVYTSIALLNQLEAKKGYTTTNFTGFPRKAESPAKVPTVKTINLTLSGPDYDVQYAYNATTNSYARSEAGRPQIDSNTNQQLSPKVVIAMVVPLTSGSLDATGAYYSDYADIGSGPAYVFQDGTVTTGQWSKSSATSQISFVNASNQTIKLNPGQTWVTAVAVNKDVSYSP